jgi:CDP-paratose 2-epimerase
MRRAGRHGVGRHAKPLVGLVEWFRPGDYDRVESVLAEAKALEIRELRTSICWADWYTSEGDGWYAWLLLRLSKDVHVLPCFLYTPPSLGLAPKFSSPPVKPKAYADFIDVMITRFGNHFDWIELWNRPNSPTEWDSLMDPDWEIFTEMIGGAAHWVRQRGKKVVLPAVWPPDQGWLSLMHRRGVLNYIDAVGVQGFPSTGEYGWTGWQGEAGGARKQLQKMNVNAEVWITQTGFSTWRGDERAQVDAFMSAIEAPVERVYWQGTFDSNSPPGGIDSTQSDERDYHYGMKGADGSPKLLYRIWSESGLDGVAGSFRGAAISRVATGGGYTLITGGAGFIGTNLAHRLLSAGQSVMIYDNLSRPGVENNLEWLQQTHGEKLRVEINDVREAQAIESAVQSAEAVFHLAAQVAVTTSLADPRLDHDVNVGGTINVLEAIRAMDDPPPLVFTSTNKVYGNLADLLLQKSSQRYQPLEASLRSGVSEDRPLDFHSPYGCSKGAADQYVLDYSRTFGIPAVVFRMSCIYGPHQFGTEDQGWVAHFLLQALGNKRIVLFGDGMQVRDLLFVEDLVDAFLLAQANIRTLSGQAFNVGGGLGNTISLLELLELVAELNGGAPSFQMESWRPGDQRYYVSDTRKLKGATGWGPKISVRKGVERLYEWLRKSRGFSGPAPSTIANEVAHALLAR